MRILLAGVACVGKSTVGDILARRLGYAFFDLDVEVEKQYETSIERLRHLHMSTASFRRACAVVLKRILAAEPVCVIALPPTGLRKPYLGVIHQFPCLKVVIRDRPENILRRLAFYDIDSKPLKKRLTAREKKLYLTEIKNDIRYFGRSFSHADMHVDIDGANAEQAAVLIEKAISGYVNAPPGAHFATPSETGRASSGEDGFDRIRHR
ncbi:hypothetical protein JW905_05385 [bacterium]|nr:hypothetical protein [candidate division CSSED10-310 bacterium]